MWPSEILVCVFWGWRHLSEILILIMFVLFLSEQEVFLEIFQKSNSLLLTQGTLALGVHPTPPTPPQLWAGKMMPEQREAFFPKTQHQPWACLSPSATLRTITPCSRNKQTGREKKWRFLRKWGKYGRVLRGKLEPVFPKCCSSSCSFFPPGAWRLSTMTIWPDLLCLVGASSFHLFLIQLLESPSHPVVPREDD